MFHMAGGARSRTHRSRHQRQIQDQRHAEPEGGRRQPRDEMSDLFHGELMAREPRGGKGLCRQHIALGAFSRTVAAEPITARRCARHHISRIRSREHLRASLISTLFRGSVFLEGLVRMRGLNPRPSVYKTDCPCALEVSKVRSVWACC